MDPCRFVRVLVSNLAIKFPTQNPNPPNSYFCKINLTDFPSQSAAIHCIPSDETGSAFFTLTRLDVDKLVAEKRSEIKIRVYSRKTLTGCGFVSDRKLLGRVVVPVELTQQVADGKGSVVLHNGWVELGGNVQVFVSVKVDPDPRFVFEFGSDPECNPQVFQIQIKGSVSRQPVFSCKFNHRSSSGECSSEKSDHQQQQRKGWSITIHDLCGSPVAAASMVTPFVPSPGTGRVSRSNPGGWLILRPGDGTWKPWGKLEAWQDEKPNRVGYKFDLSHDIIDGLTLAHSTLPTKTTGKFKIDVTGGIPTPSVSTNSSLDFGSGGESARSSTGSECGWWARSMYKGFVMTSTVGGGKVEVQVGAQHVTCTEDAAVFVALAAAVDLSMDACRPFSKKLRKELR